MSARDMKCEEVIAHLFAFLDGEVSAEAEADIERHLRRCRDCFSRAEFERRLKDRLAEVGTTRAPQRLRARVLALMARF